MRLLLVRHGETAYNRDGLGLGVADAPLTPIGLQQTAKAVECLSDESVTHILTSPLQRALGIAKGLAAVTGVAAEVRDELIEMDVGETEGVPFGEMNERFPGFLEAWNGVDPSGVVIPGGESLMDVSTRIESLVLELQALPEESVVAVVSHNFVLRLLISRLLGLELPAFRSFRIDLASISTLMLRAGEASLRTLNDCCHLDEA
ncbi:MAG: hypothetical protein CL897_05375 [Dehalococcoidia bacterium]|nr:hypothetical protein [Dehalococcoidia bacterium]|tara:strand:- start:3980 stop:4591 length:612 start_codon:yes stop_codon:yes gene_type:complete